MKGSLWPRETFHYEDLNGTKNSAKKRILRSLMTWQRFVTRCIFSQTGESRKTKSDRSELRHTQNQFMEVFNKIVCKCEFKIIQSDCTHWPEIDMCVK